ncbi:MAG: adenylate/guanylate cyclase domain-containing protein [Thiohalocapsa sp.]
MAGARLQGFILMLLLGVISGIAASAIPSLARLETSVGLSWLFNLRGERAPPDDVVLLGISRESARMLDLPSNPRNWPRDQHARMVDLLRRAGARVVVFDVMFEEARDENRDRAMAEAIQHAGNVILFQYLERDLLSASAGTLLIDVQRTRDPLPMLAEAAAGVAPFPLPNVGARVNHLWLFKRDAGDAATMPAVALQQFAQPHLPTWLALLRTALNDSAGAEPGPAAADPLQALMAHVPGGAEPDVARLTAATRTLFLKRPALASRLRTALAAMPADELAPDARRCLAALIKLYSAPNSRTLDHYGGAGTIHTIPYHRVLAGAEQLQAELRDRAVFVGYIETLQQEQKDSFRTVFSRPESPQVAGVEIAATALANLLEQRAVTPLPGPSKLALILAWASLLAAVLWRCGGWAGVLAAAGMAAAWLAIAVALFASNGLWLPLTAPLLFQLPVVLLASQALRYVAARDERGRMRAAFAHFVPERVVDDLANNLSALGAGSEQVYGVCMSTDVESYTKLAERMDPEELRTLLNQYYGVMFAPIRRNGGTITNVIGDSMMALWADRQPTQHLFEQAARAAVESQRAVAAFNAERPAQRLATRIGLHSGPIVLGNVGAADRFEYRPVGDIVNTSSRIESLGKQLGVYTLASDEVGRSQGTVPSRDLGCFVLVGKQTPIRVHELLDHIQQPHYATLREGFAAALSAFHGRRWQEAADAFERVLERFPNDGPSRFYLRLCAQYAERPPPTDWQGEIVLRHK